MIPEGVYFYTCKISSVIYILNLEWILIIEIDSILTHVFSVFVCFCFFTCFVLVLLTYLEEVLVFDKITHDNFSHRDLIIKIKVYVFI